MKECTYPDCWNPHATQCECCGKEYFCDDHGTHGYDDQVPEVGAVAVPSHCWKCGGFNADSFDSVGTTNANGWPVADPNWRDKLASLATEVWPTLNADEQAKHALIGDFSKERGPRSAAGKDGL